MSLAPFLLGSVRPFLCVSRQANLWALNVLIIFYTEEDARLPEGGLMVGDFFVVSFYIGGGFTLWECYFSVVFTGIFSWFQGRFLSLCP